MPTRVAKKGDTVSYRGTDGKTMNVTVTGEQKAPPATPTSTTATTGGTLAAATYSYRVSAVVDGVETGPSVAKTQVTTGATSTVTVDWVAVPGATSHKVYGRTGGTELLMATVTAPTVTFIDTGAVTPSGALPAANGAIKLRSIFSKQTLVQIARATTNKQTNVYFLR